MSDTVLIIAMDAIEVDCPVCSIPAVWFSQASGYPGRRLLFHTKARHPWPRVGDAAEAERDAARAENARLREQNQRMNRN